MLRKNHLFALSCFARSNAWSPPFAVPITNLFATRGLLMIEEMAHVLCYDIPDESRRRRLRNILAVFGSRVQYSVFEAFLSRSLFDNLIKQIEVLIQSDADRVAVYPVCGTCAKKRLVFGLMDREWPADPIAHVF
jgi:CRISPR-associated protein Cas2